MIRLFFTLLLISGLVDPVCAGERKLKDPEILALLSGQQVGFYDRIKEGRQRFHPDGTMWFKSYYKELTGWWKAENDQYCQSDNSRLTLRCYDLVMDGDVPTFVSSANQRYPLQLSSGQ